MGQRTTGFAAIVALVNTKVNDYTNSMVINSNAWTAHILIDPNLYLGASGYPPGRVGWMKRKTQYKDYNELLKDKLKKLMVELNKDKVKFEQVIKTKKQFHPIKTYAVADQAIADAGRVIQTITAAVR